MLIPFGVLSAAGAEVGGTYELIESVVLGTSSTSITFASLATYASTYKHLQIRAVARTDRTTLNSDFLRLRFNGDSGSNYANHEIQASGDSIVSQGTTSTTAVTLTRFGSSATAGHFGLAVIDILDAYSTSKNKTVRGLGGSAGVPPLTGNIATVFSGVFLSTSSTTSLTVSSGGGPNILTGSRFSLYGIRG